MVLYPLYGVCVVWLPSRSPGVCAIACCLATGGGDTADFSHFWAALWPVRDGRVARFFLWSRGSAEARSLRAAPACGCYLGNPLPDIVNKGIAMELIV